MSLRIKVRESEIAPVVYATMGSLVMAYACIQANGRPGTIIANRLFAGLRLPDRVEIIRRLDHRQLGPVVATSGTYGGVDLRLRA